MHDPSCAEIDEETALPMTIWNVTLYDNNNNNSTTAIANADPDCKPWEVKRTIFVLVGTLRGVLRRARLELSDEDGITTLCMYSFQGLADCALDIYGEV